MEHRPAAHVLSSIEALLDGFEVATVGAGERLDCSRVARRLASRLSAVAGLLLAGAEAAQESLRGTGTPTTSWLAIQDGLSKREAAGALHQARELSQHPDVGAAAAAGRISLGQARAIHTVLSGLDGLDEQQQARAEQVMLGLAATMDTDRLAKAAPLVVADVAADQADETLERRLQRQTEAARRNRSLTFGRDGNGSVTFSGSLPLVDGEAWLVILDAYTESKRRTVMEERDPITPALSPAQRRADALLAMIGVHQQERRAPRAGGDRPRIVVTLDYDRLRTGAADAGLVGDQPISAGDLRRLCCDADLLPAVLGAAGEVLDVGRSCRLVTPAIRTALTVRDGGCVFPGCHARAVGCDAHHIQPWQAGGITALSNLCLLCAQHHALVEPPKYGMRDQWEIRIATDGIPEAIPPTRFDPHRQPLRHARFTRAGPTTDTPPTPAPGTAPGTPPAA
ncbi:MAG: DUF222 domain-containing protein [Propionicimonas sp.]